MNSLSTEITELHEAPAHRAWILFDGDCGSCANLAARLSGVFARRGFTFEPLQAKRSQEALCLSEAEALAEMRVLMRDGRAVAGADSIIFLAQHVWWMRPVVWFAKLPGARVLLRRGYAWVAAHRHCTIRGGPSRLARTRWLPLVLLPLLAIAARALLPAWGFMWAMAFAIFAGCKWLTFSLAIARSPRPRGFRSAAYLLAWPGMDAERFLSAAPARPLSTRAALAGASAAAARVALGAVLLFAVARHASHPLLAGWIGMFGMVLILHFGSFDLISVAWRKLRIDAPPIMDAPLRSRSVAEFWGRRWNAAFNNLALRFVFRPLARRTGAPLATLAAFAASGLIHESVISLPAGAGFGLPIAYFLAQGAALLLERRFGANRLFTIAVVAGPAFWLFHPPFVDRVILPFMQTIGAL
jgi:alginate O-acetyltransferase complex protein AlgI